MKKRINAVNSALLLTRSKMQVLRFVLGFILFLVNEAVAQEQRILNLIETIALAKQNNSDLKIADKEIEKQMLLMKTSFQADPLQIQYQGGQFNSAYFDHNISVQQYFPIGQLPKANKELQQQLAVLAEKRKALTEFELEKAVTLAYYQCLYGLEIQKLQVELNSIYTKFLKNAELRHRTGESAEIEVISAKAKVQEIETQIAQLSNDIQIYQKQLQFFVQSKDEIVPSSEVALQYTPQLVPSHDKVQSLVGDYFSAQIQVYQKEAAIFQASRAPRLGVGYFAQTIDKEWLFQGFTAGLQLPLFGGVNKTKAKASEISAEQVSMEAEKQQLTMKLQQERLYNDFEKQQKAVDYYKNEALQWAQKIIESSQKSYANGDLSYWAYISFLNQAIDIKKQYVETLNKYNQSAIALQFPIFNLN